MSALHKTDIKFCINDKKINFSLLTDFQDEKQIEIAVMSWAVRTNKHTAASFRNYVNTKAVNRCVLIKD